MSDQSHIKENIEKLKIELSKLMLESNAIRTKIEIREQKLERLKKLLD